MSLEPSTEGCLLKGAGHDLIVTRVSGVDQAFRAVSS